MSIGICPQINLHFHNKNGTGFAADYRLYVYENETTTPRVSYTDYTGVSEHSQPIIIQPDGKVPGEGLFLSDEYTYTLVLCDEYDAPIDTINGVAVSDVNSGTGDGIVMEVIGSTYIEIDSTDPTAPIVSATGLATEEQLDEKVDKVEGMGLSSNDYTDIDKAKVDNLPDDTITELGLKIDTSEKGVANGVASLNDQGQVPTSQLPGTIANVQEAYVVGSTPFASDWLSETSGGIALTPSDSTIYYILSPGSYENKEYRWGGSTYVELSESLVLGNTSSTAFQGDLGQIAYDHTLDITTNPHNVTAEQVGLGNVDNTSDENKPLSDAAVTEFENYVDLATDQSVSGTKYFSDTIVMHDGLSMDSYTIPSGGSSPEPGQVLRFPESGNILEWGEAAGSAEDAKSLTINAHGNTFVADGGSFITTVSDNNGFFIGDSAGFVDDDFSTFDSTTGTFTVPEDGQYYVSLELGGGPGARTDTTVKCDLYFDGMPEMATPAIAIYGGILDNTVAYYGVSRSSGSSIVDLIAGDVYTLKLFKQGFRTGTVDDSCYIQDIRIKITEYNLAGADGTTGDPYSIPAFDASGDMISSTMLFKDNNYIDLGFEGNPNTPPASGLWNVSIGTDITYGAAANQNVILGTSLYNYGSLNEVLGDNIYNEASGCVIAGLDITNEESGRVIFGKNLTAAQCSTGAGMIFGDGDITGGCAMIGRYADSTGSYGAEGQVLARNAAGELIWATAGGEGTITSVNNELPDTAGNVALAASLIPTDDSDVQTELDSINETLSNLESATGSFTYDELLLTTTEQNLALTLVTQSSNTGIFEIDDADDTLNIKEVSNYINTINFVLSKTAALSVDMTYRIYNASGVEYFSEVITLTGNGTLTPSLTIDVKDRPIGEYYATIELDNTAGVYLQSSTNVTVVTTSVNSSLLYPPTITLSNIDSVTNTFGLLYKIASTTVSKPSYRDSQTSQFDNSDCDPSISAGGRIRSISIHSAAMAVSTATVASTVYARVGVYSILTNANGGPVLLGEYDIPITPNANIGIYNDTGTPNGTKGSLSLDLSVPAGTLLGFQLINSYAFTGDNEYINAFRNTFVGISIY